MKKIICLVAAILLFFSCSGPFDVAYNTRWSCVDLSYTTTVNGIPNPTVIEGKTLDFLLDSHGKVLAGGDLDGGSYREYSDIAGAHIVINANKDASSGDQTVKTITYIIDLLIDGESLKLHSGKMIERSTDLVDSSIKNESVSTYISGTFTKGGLHHDILKETKWKATEPVKFNTSGKEAFFEAGEALGTIELWCNKNKTVTFLIYSNSKTWKDRVAYSDGFTVCYPEGVVCFRTNIDKLSSGDSYQVNAGGRTFSVGSAISEATLDSMTNPQSFTIKTGAKLVFQYGVETLPLTSDLIFERIE